MTYFLYAKYFSVAVEKVLNVKKVHSYCHLDELLGKEPNHEKFGSDTTVVIGLATLDNESSSPLMVFFCLLFSWCSFFIIDFSFT